MRRCWRWLDNARIPHPEECLPNGMDLRRHNLVPLLPTLDDELPEPGTRNSIQRWCWWKVSVSFESRKICLCNDTSKIPCFVDSRQSADAVLEHQPTASEIHLLVMKSKSLAASLRLSPAYYLLSLLTIFLMSVAGTVGSRAHLGQRALKFTRSERDDLVPRFNDRPGYRLHVICVIFSQFTLGDFGGLIFKAHAGVRRRRSPELTHRRERQC